MGDLIQSINEASVPTLVWVQEFQIDSLTSFFGLMSWLGTAMFYIFFFPFIYWSVSKQWGITTALALLAADYISEFIKWTFKLQRPPSPPVERLWKETSPGFVSSHASDSVAVWGTLAVLVRKWWFTVLALVIILSIGISRLYLGVHFPADVIGGWLVGLFSMWLVLWLVPRISPSIARWPVAGQFAGIVALVVVILIIAPSDWEGMRPVESSVRSAGLIAGALFGLMWDHHRLHFSTEGSLGQRVLRYFAGILLVAAAYLGLSYLFSPLSVGNNTLDQSLRLIRYGLVGFVITGFAPWLFLRIGLARPATES
jgi:membrane-associated phospholipid phosphatase